MKPLEEMMLMGYWQGGVSSGARVGEGEIAREGLDSSIGPQEEALEDFLEEAATFQSCFFNSVQESLLGSGPVQPVDTS